MVTSLRAAWTEWVAGLTCVGVLCAPCGDLAWPWRAARILGVIVVFAGFAAAAASVPGHSPDLVERAAGTRVAQRCYGLAVTQAMVFLGGCAPPGQAYLGGCPRALLGAAGGDGAVRSVAGMG